MNLRKQETHPYGFCHCGCGRTTGIASQNYKPRGDVKGEPRRFVRGHSSRCIIRHTGTPIVVENDPCILLPLTKGLHTILDVSEFTRTTERNWYATTLGKTHKTHYAAHKRGNEVIYLHRFILNLTANDPREVDHRNGDGLDNRRSNLRIATKAQNAVNTGKQCNNTSGFKGVSKYRKGWMACTRLKGKFINLGTYPTREEAARAYDEFVFKLHGEFAVLNFPRSVTSKEQIS